MSTETTTPSAADVLPVTPAQIEGPYFRLGTPRRDSLIEPGINGDPLVLSGQVKTTRGTPVPNAILHFWLSDAEGNYDMVGHKLQGYTVADTSGRYSMEMIVPACYEPRQAKHIHVKVQGVSRTLTTQLFFSDDAGRLLDKWYMPELEINMQTGADGRLRGSFDFVIEQVSEGKDNVTAETFAARV
jgi:protocatechuate 3,4-dioxygenase beta subunit